jgi:hypothetical protein
MKTTLLITMASAAVLTTSSVQAALNLVADPGFEGGETGTLTSGSTPWYDPASAGTVSINGSNPFKGSFNAVITAPANDASAFLAQNVFPTSGIGYTINFEIADPGAAGTLTVLLGGASAGSIAVAGGSAYTEYNLNVTASTAPFLYFVWSSPTVGTALDIDNVSVAVPEPTTMVAGALMLLPFAASTLRLRKKASA